MSGINTAGLLVMAAGAVLVIMALRNTQSAVFPQLFQTTSSASPSTGAVIPGTNIPVTPGGKCPAGQANVAGVCVPDPHHCGDGMVWLQIANKCVQVAG